MTRFIRGLTVAGVLALLVIAYFVGTDRGQDLLLERLAVVAVSRVPPSPPDGLRIFMCGTSSPLPTPDRAQTCVAVIAGDRTYVVDTGAGSAGPAVLGGLPLENLSAILLTHFHSDHIAALYDFNLNSWVAGRPSPLQVMGPVGVERVVEGVNAMYELDRGYRVAHHGADLLPPELGLLHAQTIQPGVILEEDGLRITAFTVDHSPVSPAVGYRFDYRGRSVALSGDAVVNDNLRENVRGADLLLQDAISLPIVTALETAAGKAGNSRQHRILHDIQDYHAPTASLGELVTAADVSQLVIYHLVPPPRGRIMRRVFKRDLPPGTILATDGMTFDLPAGSDEILTR